jgi:cellulose 1,4-beta-cellobiosidase
MESDTKYQIFKLLNQEFTFDVDVSQLPCGLNGALYFVTMDADGGMAKYPTNKAGAKYGTGYCDAQCPRDLKWINGQGNVQGWTPSPNDTNAGLGGMGSCCAEMDIWEANSISTAYTPHPCTTAAQSSCSGTTCSTPGSSQGKCDQPGCDFNSYRMGEKEFYGPGKTVNTNSKMTVVTQFIGTSSTLTEIRRIYVQNGRVIQNSKTNIPGMTAYDSITTPFCAAQKTAFGDVNDFANKGGMAGMATSFNLGVVLVMSIWDDHHANMLWLDSNYPLNKSATEPGVARGTCSTSSGKPEEVEAQYPNAQVIFSNIKFGAINSTYSGTA